MGEAVTYTVTENLTSDQQTAKWKTVKTAYSDRPANNPSADLKIDSVSDADTATVTNALTGDLVLKKTLAGYPGSHNVTSSNSFTFEVELTPPSTMTRADFITYYIGSEKVDASGTTVNASAYIHSSSNSLKRLFSVNGDNEFHPIIGNLPYGTTYTITETAASKAKTSGVTGEVTSAHTINAATKQEQVTNTYPQVGSLQLVKAIAAGTTDSTPTNFIYA